MLDRTRGRAVDLGYAAGWGTLKALPAPFTRRAFRAAADAAAVRNGAGTQQLRRNLRRVVGPAVSELRMDALVGEALRSYSRYWLETFRLPSMDLDNVAAKVDAHTEGREHIETGLAAGRGVILALPHSGNWEASGVWLVAHHGPFATVAERLKPESLFDRFVAYRESLGMEVLPATGGARPPVEVLGERLRENKVVCLVADRDLSRRGIEVNFFGEPTRMPAGPALLAQQTGAALLGVHAYFVGDDSWGHSISAPLTAPDGNRVEQVQQLTQRLADRFAAKILDHPADWHMLQKLWLADLTPRRAPVAT
ncbi:phosphatidylinositol mannoside acyltransferase [uncultured Jatrophihabitans sp.]|uniref:phosphatidylinositol mannoside acyltransferase n=1 Tax=uncultured Jatrophihabitans sp. TaxID=1610747 RepID=UPI0035CBB091